MRAKSECLLNTEVAALTRLVSGVADMTVFIMITLQLSAPKSHRPDGVL